MLGAPLRGVGDFDRRHRELILGATLTAFERIITACVDHEVDFLLLSGNTFDADTLPVRAIAALCEGFQTLAEYEIPVFVASGPCDRPTAWSELPPLPETVIHLELDDGGPVEVTRDGLTIAEIRLLGESTQTARTLRLRNRLSELEDLPHASGRPFTIGVLPATMTWRPSEGDRHQAHGTAARAPVDARDCDYCAYGRQADEPTNASRRGMPVGPQALSAHDDGPFGCTLVSVDADGRLLEERLPTACVGFESASLSIDSQTTQGELLAVLSQTVTQSRAESGEDLTVLTWTIRGSGELFASLGDEAFQRELTELCELETPGRANGACVQRFVLEPAAGAGRWDRDSPEAMFLEVLQGCAPTLEAVREAASAESAQAAERWAADVLSRLAESKETVILAHAQALALGWLSAAQRAGSR